MTANQWTKEAQEKSIPTAKKNGEYWSQREIDTLFQLFDEGFSLSQIAEGLKRTYYGTSGMHSMGKKAATKFVSAQQNRSVKPTEVGKSFWSAEEW